MTQEQFNEVAKNETIQVLDQKEWDNWKANNTDGYGAGIFAYAEGWAKLMQIEMRAGAKLIDCAQPTSHLMDFMGVTGFMYGAAVSTLSKCWIHGETLRKWHNKEYNHEGDGVVNPAVLSIG